MNGRVRRPLPDVRLTVDHGLGRDFLAFKRGNLDIDAARLGALDSYQERQLVDRHDIAQGVPDFGSALCPRLTGQGANENEENQKTDNRFCRVRHCSHLLLSWREYRKR